MRRSFFCLFLILSVALCAQKPERYFLTEKGELTEGLIELLTLDGLYEEGDGLKEAVRKTQSRWIAVRQGAGGRERSDLADGAKEAESRKQVVAIASKMGIFEGSTPCLEHYDYAICLGAFLDGIRHNLAGLVAEWQRGVYYDALVFLAGERDLRVDSEDGVERLCKPGPLPLKESWHFSADVPYQTEYDLAMQIWEQTQLPETLELELSNNVFFVNAPRGGEPRPSTKDTYKYWVEAFNPKPGNLLAYSYPLLWIYQQLAGQNALPEGYVLETAAPPVTAPLLDAYQQAIVSIIHDTVAKALYELSLRDELLKP